jgi:hypothetical protein
MLRTCAHCAVRVATGPTDATSGDFRITIRVAIVEEQWSPKVYPVPSCPNRCRNWSR